MKRQLERANKKIEKNFDMSNTPAAASKDTTAFSINLFNANNSSSNSNTTTTTVTTASSNSNNIPLIQLPVAAKASSAVAPTTLAIFQNVTNSKFLSDPIDKITKELSSVHTTNSNNININNNNNNNSSKNHNGTNSTTATIPPTISNAASISYRFVLFV